MEDHHSGTKNDGKQKEPFLLKHGHTLRIRPKRLRIVYTRMSHDYVFGRNEMQRILLNVFCSNASISKHQEIYTKSARIYLSTCDKP